MLAQPVKLDSHAPRVTRALVERVMRKERKAVSAYALRAKLSDELGRRVSANSIYRILRTLERAGYARRVATSREWLLCGADGGSDLLLICQDCDAVQAIATPSGIGRLEQIGRASGFRPDRLVLEVIGRCAKCQRDEAGA